VQDTPGFIVNRLLSPYLVEAMRMLERGTSDPVIHVLMLICWSIYDTIRYEMLF